MRPVSPPSNTKAVSGYTTKDLDKKKAAKSALQEELGWAQEPKRPLICLPEGMSEDLGGPLFEDVLEGILSLDVEILILGKGSSHYGSLLTKIGKENAHRMHIVPNKKEAKEAMLAAADMALFFKDASALPGLGECLKHGVIPVAPEGALLENYNPVQESGNAFTYGELSSWHCFAALVRAIETFKLPYDWRTIQKQCVK